MRSGHAPTENVRSSGAHRRMLRYVAIACTCITWQWFLVYLCDLDFTVQWFNTHLIDRWYLEHLPFSSLWYLHSQPPNFNAFTLAVLKVGFLLKQPPEAVAFASFSVITFLALLSLVELCTSFGGGVCSQVVAVAAVLANPGVALYHQMYVYELPVLLTILWTLRSAGVFAQWGDQRWLYGTVAGLVAMALWKPLLHPALEIAIFTICVAGRAHLVRQSVGQVVRQARGPAFALMIGLAAWPVKNWLAFGTFTYSSWSAFNMAYRYPVELQRDLGAFIGSGGLTPEMERRLELFSERWKVPGKSQVLERFKRSTQAINWNNAIFLVTYDEQRRLAVEWRKNNFSEWLRISVGQYFMATRASSIFPYSSAVWGAGNDAFQLWQTAYRDVLFYDLRPFMEKVWPQWFVHEVAMLRGVKVPYSLFSVFLPVLCLAVLVKFVRRASRLKCSDVLALCMLLILVWHIAIPSLTDGAEANRMRLSICPLIVLLELYLLLPWATRALRRSSDELGHEPLAPVSP